MTVQILFSPNEYMDTNAQIHTHTHTCTAGGMMCSQQAPETAVFKSDYKIPWCCIISRFINCRDFSEVIRSACQWVALLFHLLSYCIYCCCLGWWLLEADGWWLLLLLRLSLLDLTVMLCVGSFRFIVFTIQNRSHFQLWHMYDVPLLPIPCVLGTYMFARHAHIIWHAYWWSTTYQMLVKSKSKISNHCLWNVKP